MLDIGLAVNKFEMTAGDASTGIGTAVKLTEIEAGVATAGIGTGVKVSRRPRESPKPALELL